MPKTFAEGTAVLLDNALMGDRSNGDWKLALTKMTVGGVGTALEFAPVTRLGAIGEVGIVAKARPLSIEAKFAANSLRLADEGHDLFEAGVRSGDIVLRRRLSPEIQRGAWVDTYVRRGNLNLRTELGLDETIVRINQRLYAPDGKYTVPDIHFPLSGNSIDYSYALKSQTNTQIRRILESAPTGTITIVPPSVIRPVYTIEPRP
jgi:hypothetical protein